MKNEIKNNLDNPVQLEKLYRDNKANFKRSFNLVFPDIQKTKSAQIWNARLNFEGEEISWGTNRELIFLIIASFMAGLIAKIPEFTGLDPEYFYPRNIAFVVFPLLTAYFAWKQKVGTKKLVIVSSVILVSAIYINLLPKDDKSDTLILACIHLPLLLWAGLGFMFVGNQPNYHQKRLEFLRFNGDLVVMTTILLIAGGLMTGITLGLFELIDLPIEEFYFKYIAIWGLAAAPIVGTYLVRTNPQLVNKVSPVIAKVFTPLLLIMLVIYLFAVIFTGKDPYNDREFLLIFNVLLIGVMAIILFSIAETSKNSDSKIGALTLLCLSIVTIIVNGIALSAIVFRISEWGITPNRLAVLGGNILILTNLLLVTFRQFQAIKDGDKVGKVENSIASFLPIYIVWAILVTFVFPVLFSFK
ncbi:hypothetical protein ACKGJN_07830 [Gillisia sp. Q332]|uniref:hypothetical protein n=1 Tax=Gillisia xinjiangensis TaxID=3384765 RepID=UPI00391A7B3B